MQFLNFIKLLALSVALSVAPVTHAKENNDAQEKLETFVQQVQTAKGRFTQQRVEENGEPVGDMQTGHFSFSRPGMFKWHVTKPYEQLTISDGKKILQYDPDLDQLIIRPDSSSDKNSPAAILFGTANLNEAFDLESLPDKENMNWVRAKPKADDAGFEYIDIGFKGWQPAALLLKDSFGQFTNMTLEKVTPNVDLPKEEFTFDPPEGTEIVEM